MYLDKIILHLLLVCGLFGTAPLWAVELKEAEITALKNIVEHDTGEGKGATPAHASEKIFEKSKVSTAAASMAELTFADTSITRVGANTSFSFQSKERLVKLEKGTVLINTPPGAGGATVECGGVTAAVTGTTFMASVDGNGNKMFVLLEGTEGMRVTAGGKTTLVRPGQAASVGGGEGGGKKEDGGGGPGKRKRVVISLWPRQRNLEEQKNPGEQRNLEEIKQARVTGENPRQLPQHLQPIRGRDPGKAVRVEGSRPQHRRFRFLMWMSKRSLPRHR